VAKRKRARTAAPKTRRKKSRRRRTGIVRRARARIASAFTRRPRRGRPRKRGRGRPRGSRRGGNSLSARGVVGQLKQAAVDGAWVVAGDVAGNLVKIFSGQSGLMGNAAQLVGGLGAGYAVSRFVSRDAGRFVMAGAAAGIVRQLVVDQVIPHLPVGTLKTNFAAALAGYPHSDVAALGGYVNAGMSANGGGAGPVFGI
jgi:hypothetical protein